MPQAAKKQNAETSELTQEYVVGGRGYYSSEVLSNGNFDDLFPNFTNESQRLMRYDSEVESSVEFLINSVFAEGISPVSPITSEDHPEFAKAQEIAVFVAAATSEPARSVETVLREIFRGAYYAGVKVGEIVLRVNDKGETVLDRINPKANDATAFVVDKFKNVVGLVGATENGTLATSFNPKPEEIIRRDKFIVLNFEMVDNDPRGYAKIKAAFEAWCDKRKTRPQYEEWRRTSAIPKKFGTTAQGAKDHQLRGADGQKLTNSDGSPKTISAQKGLMNALEGFANNSTVTAEYGTVVKQLEVQGTGIQFLNGFKLFNSEIRKAILGDSVTTGQDDKGINAAKETAMNVVELGGKSFKNSVAEYVKRDLYRLITIVNFGLKYAHLTPNASLGDTDRRDWNATAGALQKVGYKIAPEHLREGDALLGFKPRETTETVQGEEKQGNSGGDENTGNQAGEENE